MMSQDWNERPPGFAGWILTICLIVLISGMYLGVAFPVHANNRAQPLNWETVPIELSGHLFTTATFLQQDFQDGTDADKGSVDVNSLELGATVSPLRALDAEIVWLLEEELDGGGPDDSFSVDQAFVTLAGNHRVLANRGDRKNFDVSPWYLKAGKFYSPFGTQMEYHTFDVISEPQTLALAETLETSFLVGYAPSEWWQVYLGGFSGDGSDRENGSAEDGDLDDVVAGMEFNSSWLSLDAQWTNNLNNSIVLVDELGDKADANGGVNLYGSVEYENWWLQVAHTMALDEFDQQSGNFAGNQPQATTVELTHQELGRLAGRPVAGTLVYEQTDEWPDHPDDIWGGVVDVPLYIGVTGSLEFIHRDFNNEFSNDLDDETLVSFQLGVEFSQFIGGGGS